MSEARHIFLSYRSIEVDFALKLASDLKNAGANLWMDRLDEIRGGDDWRRQIEAALSSDQCALMITILSPDYLIADYCRNELARADRLKIPILPILLYPVPDMPIELERVQYISFCDVDRSGRLARTWREDALYTERLRQLLDALPAAQKGRIPNAETQYLISLIGELEAARGVLQYVTLSGQMNQSPEIRPKPLPVDEWGYAELVRITRPVELDTPETHERYEKRIPMANIAQAVEKHPRFVLIGEPGTGKTTTIRRLALDAARARLDNPRTVPIPLLLNLSQWDKEASPSEFVRSQWSLGGDPAEMLKRGDILLYMDGLNEMGAAGIHRAQQLREWFESQDAPAHAIVTCRVGDYAGDFRLGDAPSVLVIELTERQIQQFVTNYLADRAAGFLNNVLPDTKREQESARSLVRLAHNPYMLSALMIVYEQVGDLPHNAGKLFRGLVRALWEREKQRNTPGWITFDQMEKVFGSLAFAIIDEQQLHNVPMPYILQKLGSESLLRAGTSATYLILNNDEVRFYHQLILEYFAASGLKYVARRKVEPVFRKWGIRETHLDEIILMFCELENSEERIRKVLEINPYLVAAFMKRFGVLIDDELATNVLKRVFVLSKDKNPYVRINAVFSLGQIPQEYITPELISSLQKRLRDKVSLDPWTGKRICDYAADALNEIGTPQALDVVAAWQQEQN